VLGIKDPPSLKSKTLGYWGFEIMGLGSEKGKSTHANGI